MENLLHCHNPEIIRYHRVLLQIPYLRFLPFFLIFQENANNRNKSLTLARGGKNIRNYMDTYPDF